MALLEPTSPSDLPAAAADPGDDVSSPSQGDASSSVGNRWDWLTPKFLSASLQNIGEIFPTRRVAANAPPAPLTPGSRTQQANRDAEALAAFAAQTDVLGLIVLDKGAVAYEHYAQGAGPRTRFLGFSITKSILSALVGIAISEGMIGGVDDLARDYLPDLAGTAYHGVRLRDLLRMGSGSAFSEIYERADSGIGQLIVALGRNEGGVYEVCRGAGKTARAGSRFNYSSADSEILGVLLARAAGTSLSDYLSSRLWSPMGAEDDAAWVLDQPGRQGREIASGGLSARLRDFARFGRLAARLGRGDEAQIVPEPWMRQSLRPRGTAFQYGRLMTGTEFGYGYHWWLTRLPAPVGAAMGVHGQFVLVSPRRDLVLACVSSWPEAFMADRHAAVFDLFAKLHAPTP